MHQAPRSAQWSDWLALLRIPGLGAVGYAKLLEHFESPSAVLRASRGELARCGIGSEVLDRVSCPDWRGVERDLAWLRQPGRTLITVDDDDYPPLLRQSAGSPPVLFVRGDPKVLSSPQLAIVGSRNPTPTGAETAYEFAAALAEIGWVITSGLAIGIDSQAHRGALAVDGRTVAVLASGADQIYPPQHHDLAESVASAGAYLSELPIGTPVRRQQFPSRNRIISGLSVGTLVVEAARRSGSLITARHAADQGREVFAIPGSIHSPVSRGCHQLIREGAKLVESVEDIVNELGAMLVSDAARRRSASRGSKTEAAQPDLEASYHKLLDCISYDPVSVDALVHRSGLTAREVSSMLLMLELQGRVTSLAGGLYTRSQSAQ